MSSLVESTQPSWSKRGEPAEGSLHLSITTPCTFLSGPPFSPEFGASRVALSCCLGWVRLPIYLGSRAGPR